MPQPPLLYRFLFLAAPLLLFAGIANAQIVKRGSNAAINIDSASRLPDNPIPFDQAFSMILTPRNPQTITNIVAIQLIKDKNGNPSYLKGSKEVTYVGYKIMGPKVVIDFYPIKANKSFDVFIQRKLDSAKLDAFLDIVGFAARSRLFPADYTPDQIATETNLYTAFRNSLLPATQLSPKGQSDVRNSKLNISPVLYDFLYQADCDRIPGNTKCRDISLENYLSQDISADIFAIINTAAVDPGYGSTSDFSTDLQDISQTYLVKKFYDQTIANMIAIWDDKKQDQLFNGLISADYKPLADPKKKEDIAARDKNFQTTFQRLQGLQDTVTKLSNELINPIAAFPRAIKYLEGLVNAFKAAQKTADDHINKLTTTFTRTGAIIYSEYYVSSNNGFKDLQTASGSFISPQIGLSFLRLPKNIGGYQVTPKITLGVNINCKPINKSLIRADIPNKNIWNYLSVFFGITFGGFSDTEYTNLLASNSLLGGINYRVNRSVYFSLGASAFKLQNKNPVINAYHPAFGVYASALIDIDVASAASSFVSFFTK